jgi:hypothetical protein
MKYADARSSLRRVRHGWLLVLLAGALLAQQPAAGPPGPAPDAPAEPAKGQIAGMVVSANTGEPLKGASVLLRGTGQGRGQGPRRPLMRDAVAGLDGRFVFSELPAGEYDLVADKPGYGGQFSYRPQARIQLGSDESRKDAVLRLQPSAVVTGRVIDAYGEPLPEAQVYALSRRTIPDRESRWMTVQRTESNDLGEYRLHSLEAGKYVIAAQGPRAASPRGVGFAEFAVSYYPAAAALDQATPMKLSNGAEVNGVDFRLELSPDTTVRGIVVDGATGKPCDHCGLRVSEGSAMGLEIGAQTTQEGLFSIHGLRAGAHSFLANACGGGGRGGGGGRPRWFAEQVQVPESGEVEVQLFLGGLQTVSGEFILEDVPEQQPAAAQRPGAAVASEASERQRPAMLNLESLGPFPFPGGQARVPPQGGPFEVGDVTPGDYRIRVYGIPDGGYLRSLTLGGRELGGPRITVPRDGPLAGLEVHIGFDGASITGVVKPASNDEPSAAGGNQIVTALPDAGSNPYASHLGASVQAGGEFVLRGLAPGGYTLFVVRNAIMDTEDPEVRRALKPYSKHVSLAKREEARVELTAVPDSVELW